VQESTATNNRATPMSATITQYTQEIERCKSLFTKKLQDYGTSWRVLRSISIADQVYIKAWRIRQIQENGHQRIDDSIESEFIGIVNYSIIALIQAALPAEAPIDLPEPEAATLYDKQVQEIRALMQRKNHDYGEAWRELSQASFVDLILAKLLRIRQIIANKGKTQASEGIEANFQDIVNYGIFALIKMAASK
jgi:hypothetical protein